VATVSDGVGPALAEPASDTPIPSPARGLSVVFVCQAVDRDDPILAHTVRWIEALARQPRVGRVTVLALRTGRHDLPAAVEVRRFGRSNAFARLVAFYREAVRSLRHRPDLFFICQGGPYPLLLLPFKLLRRVRVVQWKAHPVIGPAMAFYARWCDDLVFTATRASFPLALEKVRVVGHGIDTELFRAADRPRIGDLIAACRIAPRKRVEEMVAAVVRANREFGTRYRLNIYGPTLPGGEAYAAGLERAIDRLGARDWVALHGPVSQDRLPALLNRHRAFLNFSETAVDKAVLEALACGLPVTGCSSGRKRRSRPSARGCGRWRWRNTASTACSTESWRTPRGLYSSALASRSSASIARYTVAGR
jgi:glycosyltransferase involved in cell wall biosynthesis